VKAKMSYAFKSYLEAKMKQTNFSILTVKKQMRFIHKIKDNYVAYKKEEENLYLFGNQ
jgi:DNA-dependent RNA polymerase auxiliary subunit epsilon